MTLTNSLTTALATRSIYLDPEVSTVILPNVVMSIDAGVSEIDPQSKALDLKRYALTLNIKSPNLEQTQMIQVASQAALDGYSDNVIRSVNLSPTDSPASTEYGYSVTQTYSVLAVERASRRHDGRGRTRLSSSASVIFTPAP